MAIKLKQSTASQEIPLGYFVDSVDGNTEETGLTIANTDIKLWKAGATTLANKNSGGATHISNGIYYCVLDATDTDTLGPLVIFIHVSGALAVRVECEVLAANVYDSLIAASDKLDVDTFQVTANAITAAAIATGAIDADAIADNAIDAGAIAADAITAAKIAADAIGSSELAQAAADKVWSTAARTLTAFGFSVTVGTNNDKTGYSLSAAAIQAIWDALTSALTTVGSIGKLLVDNINATISSRATQTSVDTVDDFLDTEIAAIKAKTDNLPADPADASDVAASFTTVNTKLDAIDDFIDTEVAAILAAVDTEVAAIKAKTDNLPASPAATGDIPSAATIADAVWDEAIAGHLGAGSTGAALNGASAPSAAAVADAVWDEAIAGHLGAGSTGEKLNGASAPSAATVADAVWDEAISGHLTAGSTGAKLNGLSSAAGGGSIAWVITVNDGSNPIEGVQVWVTTDVGGSNIVASGITDTNGQVTVYLDAGTYYAWKQKSHFAFTNPQSFTVS